MRLIRLLGIVLLITGCSQREQKLLGAAFEGTAISLAAARQANAESRVVVHGSMIQKCPVAGCWFVLRDESGTMKVDTKNAGFVVLDIPLQTELLVAGRVVTNGAERSIDASGLRF